MQLIGDDAALAARPSHAWVHSLLHDAGPLALAGLLANGGSLLVTVVLAHLLDARGYGALNQLVGIFFVVSTPGTAVLVAVVRRVSASAGDPEEVGAWAARAHRRALVALVGFAALLVAVGPALGELLGRHDPKGIDAIAMAGALWLALCVDRGLLQGRRAYRALSRNLLVEGGLRTVLMLGAALAGGGVAGVAAGVMVAELGTAWHARHAARVAWGFRPGGSFTSRPAGSESGPVGAAYGSGLVAAVVALAAIALLQYVDVIVVEREAPHDAGPYAAVSVACKALVFLALVVAGYLIPEAALSWREGRHALGQLFVAASLVGVPGAALVALAAFVPRSALGVFFARRYLVAAPAFLPLAAAMVCLSATVLVALYLLAVGDRSIAALLSAGALVALVAVTAAHGAPRPTALADAAVQGGLAFVSAAELYRVHRRRAAAARGLAA